MVKPDQELIRHVVKFKNEGKEYRKGEIVFTFESFVRTGDEAPNDNNRKESERIDAKDRKFPMASYQKILEERKDVILRMKSISLFNMRWNLAHRN